MSRDGGLRIRELAAELEVGERELLALVRATAGARYTTVEDRLPTSLGELVRTRARDLPRVQRGPSTEVDAALLQMAYAGVKPISPQPIQKGTGARSAANTVRPPVAARSAALPVGSPVGPPSGSTSGGRSRADAVASPPPGSTSGARPRPSTGMAPIEELRTAERDAAVRERDAARAEVERLRAQLQAASTGRDAAQAALLAREASTRTLPDLLARRGLRGEDEVALFLRALLDARREGTLLRTLRVEDEASLWSFLEERVLLLGEAEEAPPGAVVVRVAPERSEGVGAPATKAALNRLSTLCLVRGWRRLTFIGLHGGLARALREGLDARLVLTFLAGPRELPADVIFALDPVAGALPIRGRTVLELVQSAAAAIEEREQAQAPRRV